MRYELKLAILIHTTARAAIRFAGGEVATVVGATLAVSLAREVLRFMPRNNLRIIALALVCAGAVARPLP